MTPPSNPFAAPRSSLGRSLRAGVPLLAGYYVVTCAVGQ